MSLFILSTPSSFESASLTSAASEPHRLTLKLLSTRSWPPKKPARRERSVAVGEETRSRSRPRRWWPRIRQRYVRGFFYPPFRPLKLFYACFYHACPCTFFPAHEHFPYHQHFRLFSIPQTSLLPSVPVASELRMKTRSLDSHQTLLCPPLLSRRKAVENFPLCLEEFCSF